MTKVLFCELSGALSASDAHLHEATTTLKLPRVYSISRDTAIAFVENENIAASIVRKGTVGMGDTRLTFSFGEDTTSRYLEIQLSILPFGSDITEAVKRLAFEMDALVSLRNSAVLIEFKSRYAATEGHKVLTKVLKDHESIVGMRLLNIAEHRLLRCQWRSDPSSATAELQHDCKMKKDTLEGQLRHTMSLWKEQPMITAIQHTLPVMHPETSLTDDSMPHKDKTIMSLRMDLNSFVSTAESVSTDIVIICPTESDSQIFKNMRTIQLPGGDIVVIPDLDDNFREYTADGSSGRNTLHPTMRLNSEGAADSSFHIDDGYLKSDKQIAQETQIKTIVTLDLECYAIANYFKLLLKWGFEAANTSIEPGFISKEEYLTDENDTPLLWGEEPERIGEGNRVISSINVVLENKAKNYGLIISSFSSNEATERMGRMKQLVSTAVRLRQTIPMKEWCPQHREAINESDALCEVLKKTKSAVLFHESKDRVISADVVALSGQDQIVVHRFLVALVPRQAEWSVPQDCVAEYTSSNWVEIRRKYAIKLDVKGGEKRVVKGLSGSQKGTKSLKVWGFEPSMEHALRHILAASASCPISLFGATAGQSNLHRKSSLGRIVEPIAGRIVKVPIKSYRDRSADLDDQQDELDLSSKSYDSCQGSGKESLPFHGHYIFLDREAGMLYQAFEAEFQAFLSQTYNVSMKYSQSTLPESGAYDMNGTGMSIRPTVLGSDASSQLQAQYRTPALKIEFSGNNKNDISSVRNYMEKINSTNLSRQQIHFPRYDAMRYRELYNQKTKQDANVRMIRRHSIEKANCGAAESDLRGAVDQDDGYDPKSQKLRKSRDSIDSKVHESDSAKEIMPDPLLTVGFINIRIRPPLHSRGIRRMTFPAEITITVCSPVNTESQLADYTTLCEHFTSMDSHYITASVEMPLASNLAKEIIVRATREEFISKYGLVSLRWDENSLRRDCANIHVSSLMASSSLDEAMTSQDMSTSASESKREDVQLGVAKLWATKPEIMKNALDRLCKADGVIISVSMGNKIHNDSDGTALCPISLSDILPPSSALGKFRPAIRSSQAMNRAGLNSPSSLNSDTIKTDSEGSNCVLENFLGHIRDDGDADRSETQSIKSAVTSGFDHFLPFTPHKISNSFPVNSRDQNSIAIGLSAFGAVSPYTSLLSHSDILPMQIPTTVHALKKTMIGQKSEITVDSLTAHHQLNLSSHAMYPQHAFNNENHTVVEPVASRLLTASTNPISAPRASSSYPSLLSLPSSQSRLFQERLTFPQKPPSQVNEQFASKAAPGLNIATDWDQIFQKIDSRTQGNIPRPLTDNYPFRSERTSPTDDIKRGFSNDGFTSISSSLSASLSPTSAFTAVRLRDRALSMSGIQKDFYGQESYSLLTPSSLHDLNHTRGGRGQIRGGQGTSFRDNDGRYSTGTSIFDDSLNLGRRRSLDSSETTADGLRLSGLSSLESSIRLNTRKTNLSSYGAPVFDAEQYTQNFQQVQHQHQIRPQFQTSNMIENRVVIHWPHPSFRFMFLGDPLKYQLSDLLHKFRARGVGISTPFRDKSNPIACLVIEGTSQGVAAASAHVDSYFRSIICQVRSVKMVLTSTQREKLTSADLSRVKEIQGSAGAHIILDPQLDDLSEALSSFDFRLPFSDSPQKATSSGHNLKHSTAGDSGSGGEAVPLIVVQVISQSGQAIEVSVIPNKMSSSSWVGDISWCVSSILMLIDSNAYAGLNAEERHKIDNGKILVNRDPITGKTVLRVWIRCSPQCNAIAKQRQRTFSDPQGYNNVDYSGRSPWYSDSQPQQSDQDAEFQAGALIEALSDGLGASDALNLSRMAVIVPTGNFSLLALSADLIRTITVEASVNFLKGAHMQSLQRIVFVDSCNGAADSSTGGDATLITSHKPRDTHTNSEGTPNGISFEIALKPACGNRMALTMLLLLEQASAECRVAKEEARAKHYDPNSLVPLGRQERDCFFRNIGGDRRREELESYELPSPNLFLLLCNVPLPCSMSAETVCPEIIMFQQQQRARERAAAAAYTGLGFDGNVPTQSMNSLSYTTRDDLSDQIADFRSQSERGQEGPCVVMLRGLPLGILRALRAIKQLVASKSLA